MLEMAGYNWKWLDFAGLAKNGYKLLDIARKAGNC